MTRRLLTFPCEGEILVGTLDEGSGSTGLLIVTGGNEVRAGAHRGMALLAARLAGRGTPVFRFDRRGVGDSSGSNTGFRGAREDLLAAAAAFRAQAPHVTHLVGFGNCDGATALAWWGREAGCDSVVLANPWAVEPTDALPPPAAIRAHYAARLRDPAAWVGIMRRGLSLPKLLRGLRSIAAPAGDDGLTAHTIASIAQWSAEATIVLAQEDGTAIAYADAARRAGISPRTVTVETGSHSFARTGDAEALETAIRQVLNAPE
ncbi:hydrolase 1, exosortase A system-associated [Sphingomonas sp.]|uniref:hydrolase 1, exosortase A system-associated n=1 Tax=Sphingomonas sp. TaxID=28214 RepID=UPI00262C3E7B|nr:hydrolase 1, exosortase A system-associated [Sphingomonas sp.]MDF2494738.1 hydrolase 1, exosortase system-associated [Sphingomonas sp.]